jgi:hypothetical protein
VCIEPEGNARGLGGGGFLCEKSLGFELSRSLRCKECAGNRSLHQTKLRRNNTLGKCCRDPGIHFPGEAKAETFGDLENSSKSERLKSSGGGALLTVRLR